MTVRMEFDVPFFRPSVGAAEAQAVRDALTAGWLTTGPICRRFEERLADVVGAPHAVATSSCTAALELALAALDVGPGDEVITTPYSFTASAEVVLRRGARLRFVDVDPDTLNLAPAAVAAALRARARPRVVLPVHIAGEPCALSELDELARRVPFALVEDAAHALPCEYRGRPVGAPRPGGATRAVCFSFHATKTVTTGEGGAVVTAETELAARCRRLALHGIDRDPWGRQRGAGRTWQYEVVEVGAKCNLGDLAAAIGLVQLDRLEELRERRRERADRYDAGLRGNALVETPQRTTGGADHLYIVRLAAGRFPPGARDDIADALAGRGIETSVHYRPLHLHRAYRGRSELPRHGLPVAEEVAGRVLSLPLYPELRFEQVDRVLTILCEELRRRAR